MAMGIDQSRVMVDHLRMGAHFQAGSSRANRQTLVRIPDDLGSGGNAFDINDQISRPATFTQLGEQVSTAGKDAGMLAISGKQSDHFGYVFGANIVKVLQATPPSRKLGLGGW